MSTTLRLGWLKALRMAGRRHFVARSGLGHPFVCHLGDFFGELPFFNRHTFRQELELCAAWLRLVNDPVVIDVGANVGFWSTHLAQMVGGKASIYALEPVPQTFCKLVESIEVLALGAQVHPIAAAISASQRLVTLSVNPKVSGFAQVTSGALNPRVGDRLAQAIAISLDDLVTALGVSPSLLKIDVEGSEISVLKSCRELLARENRPALLFEFNPLTLSETGVAAGAFLDLLGEYALFYVDDFDGQKREFGVEVKRLDDIDWVCNIFAVPANDQSAARFALAMADAKRALDKRHG